MEQKKKKNCCCFGFFRRGSTKVANPPVQNSVRPEVQNLIDNSAADSSNANRSYSYSQKKFEIKSNFRSCIVTPARRTPNLNKLINTVLSKTDLNNTIETSISRPNTFRDFQKPLVKQANPEKLTTQLLRSELRTVTNDLLKAVDEECLKKKQSPLWVPSPDWFSNSSKFVSPALESLGMSPIKNEVVGEDFSDIEGILSNTERFQRVPDVFIRNCNMNQRMPVIKPITPGFFNRKRVLPSLRKENRNLLNELNVCE